jgi:hypothetical protein
LDKGETLNEFIAVPVFFETEARRLGIARGHIKTGETPSISNSVHQVNVRRVWYTSDSIELELSNDMHVSIQTKPLTLAMSLTAAQDDNSVGFVQTQIIPYGDHDAATVEARIRNLRQVYAIACIAYGGAEYAQRLRNTPLLRHVEDFESFLPDDERLLISAAGQGSFWATVGLKAVGMAKAAPRTALVALSVIFKGGPQRVIRAADAIVKEKEGAAEKAIADARMVNAQALKAEAEVEITQATAREAPQREALITQKQVFDLQKERVDAYFDIQDRIDKLDPTLKADLLASLSTNSKDLLGAVASEWIEGPRRLG